MVETKELSAHIQGKVIQADYDFITSLDDDFCQYCLSQKHIQMILSITDYFGWSTRWYSSSGEIDRQTILDLQGGLINALMNECCNETIIATRANPETGAIEITFDGINWQDASLTGDDPRYTSPQLPPLPTSGSEADDRCRSATNAVSAMQTAIEAFGGQLGTVGSIIALAGAIALAVVGVFAVPPSATVLIPIIIGLAQAIYSIASGTYLALFTSDVYNDLQCILYCHCPENGTYEQSDYLDILSGIDSGGFDSSVALTFTSVLRGWVLPGLNAAARGGELAVGDCSDCDCSCPTAYNWTDSNNVISSDDTCHYTAASNSHSPTRQLYIGSEPDPVSFPVSPGFRVISAIPSVTTETVGYYNLDGTVITGHLPDPSGYVAGIFFEHAFADFTVDFELSR